MVRRPPWQWAERERYVGLLSNKVIVLDGKLNQLNTITLSGIVGLDWVYDISVMRDTLFVRTAGKAFLYSKSGLQLTERLTCTAMDETRARSIDMSSELVYVLWYPGNLITVYSRSSLVNRDADLPTLPVLPGDSRFSSQSPGLPVLYSILPVF